MRNKMYLSGEKVCVAADWATLWRGVEQYVWCELGSVAALCCTIGRIGTHIGFY
ncbi:hypothetical protein [Bacteroides thetaiotaomicron]|uniref:hypothetical protein n=1 Tax=Bacteroides thetaiotaomicron TaxID=818 RepID=UPI001CE3B4C2|nr:hypothetical protein [Bacteroides thetaiotaomicron]MCA5983231.1 hypothetical protein [Bacteroides thetaiotaomicron]